MQFLTLPVVIIARTLPTFVPSITHFKIEVLTCRTCQSPSHTQFWRVLRVIHLRNGRSRMFMRSWTRLSKSCIPCICTRMTQGMTRNLDRFGYQTLCRRNNSFIVDLLTLPLLMTHSARAKKCDQKTPVSKNSKLNYPRCLAKGTSRQPCIAQPYQPARPGTCLRKNGFHGTLDGVNSCPLRSV